MSKITKTFTSVDLVTHIQEIYDYIHSLKICDVCEHQHRRHKYCLLECMCGNASPNTFTSRITFEDPKEDPNQRDFFDVWSRKNNMDEQCKKCMREFICELGGISRRECFKNGRKDFKPKNEEKSK